MAETFLAGVRPGGLTKDNEVRILICHILAAAGEPLTFEQLTEAALSDGDVNYFEFAEAAAALAELECVVTSHTGDEELLYSLTDKGREAASTLARELPAAVRERGSENAAKAVRRRRLERENLAVIDRAENGFVLRLRVTDIGADLMELKLFMPTFEQAQRAKTTFLADPAATYRAVLEALRVDG